MGHHAYDYALLADYCSLLALAYGARIYKFSRPHMTTDNVIHIKGMSTLKANTSYPGWLLLVQNMFGMRKALNEPFQRF